MESVCFSNELSAFDFKYNFRANVLLGKRSNKPKSGQWSWHSEKGQYQFACVAHVLCLINNSLISVIWSTCWSKHFKWMTKQLQVSTEFYFESWLYSPVITKIYSNIECTHAHHVSNYRRNRILEHGNQLFWSIV